MSFATLTRDDPIPPDGEFEIAHRGKRFAVVHHPRIVGNWMAFTPPKDWRDSGMKRCTTRAAAVGWVTKRLAEQEIVSIMSENGEAMPK